jgi:hypothetical protein
MTTAVTDTRIHEATAPRRRMDPTRKVALAGGIAYLITFAASIPQLKLFADVVDDPTGYISGPRSNTALLWGCGSRSSRPSPASAPLSRSTR